MAADYQFTDYNGSLNVSTNLSITNTRDIKKTLEMRPYWAWTQKDDSNGPALSQGPGWRGWDKEA